MLRELLGDIHAPGSAHKEDIYEERLLRTANGFAEVGCDGLADHRVVDLPGMLNPGIRDQRIDILSGEVLGVFKPADDASMGLVDIRSVCQHLHRIAGDKGIDVTLALGVIHSRLHRAGHVRGNVEAWGWLEAATGAVAESALALSPAGRPGRAVEP